MDVFWDEMIRPGKFKPILEEEIESREYFLAIMTPSSARKDSYCRKELKYAQSHNRKIIPIRILNDYEDQELEGHYTRADFSLSYDKGFRKLTQLIIGQPRSTWEYLAEAEEEEVLLLLAEGNLPMPVMQDFGTWLIVDHLWPFIERQVKASAKGPMWLGSPRTVKGVFNNLKIIPRQLSINSDPNGILIHYAKESLAIVQAYISGMNEVTEADNARAGEITDSLINATQRFYVLASAALLDAFEVGRLQATFKPDMVEKIKDLVIVYSRRLTL